MLLIKRLTAKHRLIILLISIVLISGRIWSGTFGTDYIRRATVKIIVSYIDPDYCSPWKMKSHNTRFGSGAIIKGERILTNAHVVSNSTYLQIQKENDPKLYDASVLFISHEADLAIIIVKDKTFYKNTAHLKFGAIPTLRSRVATYGYPVGGERISITEGVVSRIEIGIYAHDSESSFLMIQTDAAINPGNSGGPVIQKGRIVGVAFQKKTKYSNIGYMIPVPVIKHFLKDMQDGRYDGFPYLGIITDKLQNKSYREYLGMKDDQRGIIITHVIPGGSAYNYLKRGDVIISINDHEIANDGSIEFSDGRIKYNHLVYSNQIGDIIKVSLWRQKKKLTLRFPLKKFPVRIPGNNEYDVLPRYIIFNGIIFQTLSNEYLKCWGRWPGSSDPKILYYYYYHIFDDLERERKEFVIINRVLPDITNTYVSDIHDKLVDEINGIKILELDDVLKAFAKPSGSFHILKLEGVNKPVVLKASDSRSANERILKKYRISRSVRLNNE